MEIWNKYLQVKETLLLTSEMAVVIDPASLLKQPNSPILFLLDFRLGGGHNPTAYTMTGFALLFMAKTQQRSPHTVMGQRDFTDSNLCTLTA
jgi:hypothetical protein